MEDNIIKGKAILEIQIPATQSIWDQVRVALGDSSTRVGDLSNLIASDPAIVIELLRVSNSSMYSAGRSPATNVKLAIERVGAEVAIEILDSMQEFPACTNPALLEQLDLIKKRCLMVGGVAKILCESLARTSMDDCEITALLLHTGELLAVLALKEEYLKAMEGNNRVKLLYRLEKDFKFDVQKICLQYLRKIGIPEAVLFGIDPEAQSKAPGKGIIKPICQAASEMVIAFESERWEKLAPGNQISPKSAIRLLALSDNQYTAIYEKVSQYFGVGSSEAEATV